MQLSDLRQHGMNKIAQAWKWQQVDLSREKMVVNTIIN